MFSRLPGHRFCIKVSSRDKPVHFNQPNPEPSMEPWLTAILKVWIVNFQLGKVHESDTWCRSHCLSLPLISSPLNGGGKMDKNLVFTCKYKEESSSQTSSLRRSQTHEEPDNLLTSQTFYLNHSPQRAWSSFYHQPWHWHLIKEKLAFLL